MARKANFPELEAVADFDAYVEQYPYAAKAVTLTTKLLGSKQLAQEFFAYMADSSSLGENEDYNEIAYQNEVAGIISRFDKILPGAESPEAALTEAIAQIIFGEVPQTESKAYQGTVEQFSKIQDHDEARIVSLLNVHYIPKGQKEPVVLPLTLREGITTEDVDALFAVVDYIANHKQVPFLSSKEKSYTPPRESGNGRSVPPPPRQHEQQQERQASSTPKPAIELGDYQELSEIFHFVKIQAKTGTPGFEFLDENKDVVCNAYGDWVEKALADGIFGSGKANEEKRDKLYDFIAKMELDKVYPFKTGSIWVVWEESEDGKYQNFKKVATDKPAQPRRNSGSSGASTKGNRRRR